MHGSSILTSYGPSNTLWAGRFNEFTRDTMHAYVVGDDGDLGPAVGRWEVPTKTLAVEAGVAGDEFAVALDR
ncbi:MAG TPA: hypothetical protein VIW24_14875 [Aldersonia sp.]